MKSDQVQINLKHYFDVRIKEIISYSDKLSNKFLTDRQELLTKIENISRIKIQIKNTIHIFNEALKVTPQLREEISNVKGMSTDEIMQKKAQLQSLYELYEGYQASESVSIRQNYGKKELGQTLKQINNDTQYLTPKKQSNRKPFILVLQIYEGLCCFLGVLAFIIVMYKQIF